MNIYKYLTIVLLGLLIACFVVFKIENTSLKEENANLKDKRKKELRRVRDSASTRIDFIINKSKKELDSIYNLPPQIRWEKYEKTIFIDRTVDDALDIHSEYKSNTRAGK